jgi:hypothetical protein
MRIALALGLTLAVLPRAVGAAPCDALPVPADLGLACTADMTGWAEVTPSQGLWSALSRLEVRELDRVQEPQAWTEPQAWLRRQVTYDLTGMVERLVTRADDPDSPFGNGVIDSTLAGIADTITGWAKAAEEGCVDDAARDGRSGLSCRWEAGPLALGMILRVVAHGDRRFAVRAYAMNERRLRHLTAIANGFRPDRW